MNPINTKIIMYIASPIYPASIIELIIKMSRKFLFVILNFAAKKEIKIIDAKAKIDGCPRNRSKITFFISSGSIYVPILI